MNTIGILGSGHVGTSLARASIAHGYDVILSNTRGPGFARATRGASS